MKSHAYLMFLRRALFWLAAFFAVGGLVAQSAKTTIHWTNNTAQSISGVQVGYQGGAYPDAFHVEPGITTVAPGATVDFVLQWYSGSEGGTDGIDWAVGKTSAGFTTTGNSFIKSGADSFVVFSPGSYTYLGDYGNQSVSYNGGSFAPDSTPDDQKTLWVVNDTTLTADLFREGIDKVVYAKSSSSSSGGGGGGGTTDPNQTAFFAQHADYAAHPGHMLDSVGQLADSLGVDAAANDAKTAIAALMPTAPTSIDYSAPSGGSSFLQITLPATFGGSLPGVHAIDFNPFTEDRMLGVATWFRYAMQWLAYFLLGRWVFQQFGEWLRAMGQTQQAKGNPLFGGTGAQGSALVNAIAISAAVVVAVTALLAWGFNSINIAGLLTSVGTNPLLGMVGNAYWFLDQMLPLATILSCAVARFMFMVAANTIYSVFFTVVRFLVI